MVEITERALEVHPDEVRPFLDNLRSLGVRTALDDFGTGYSSLARLKFLPFDEIKISQSFVQNIDKAADRTLFVHTIVQLGRGLGMAVTAEGIEDSDQRDSLIAEGCTQGQGFLFSEAVPAERVHVLLASRRKAAAGGRSR